MSNSNGQLTLRTKLIIVLVATILFSFGLNAYAYESDANGNVNIVRHGAQAAYLHCLQREDSIEPCVERLLNYRQCLLRLDVATPVRHFKACVDSARTDFEVRQCRSQYDQVIGAAASMCLERSGL